MEYIKIVVESGDDKEKISHFGVYGIILNPKDNTVLLIKKARGPYTGMLDLPGGSPEFNETLEETLCREVSEETGLQVQQCKQLQSILNIGKYKELLLRHIGIIYFVNATGRLKKTTDFQDSNDCKWVNIQEISKLNCTPFAKKIEAILGLQ